MYVCVECTTSRVKVTVESTDGQAKEQLRKEEPLEREREKERERERGLGRGLFRHKVRGHRLNGPECTE